MMPREEEFIKDFDTKAMLSDHYCEVCHTWYKKQLLDMLAIKDAHIASLEDALKRADGIPSIEDIDRLLDKHTVFANDYILYRKGIAQAIHALITTRSKE